MLLVSTFFLRGSPVPPWRRGPDDAAQAPPGLKKWWDLAAEQPVGEHEYLLQRTLGMSRDEVWSLSNTERILRVARILQDDDLVQRRHNHLVDVLIQLLGKKR